MAILVLTYSTELGKFYSQLIGTDQLAPAAVLSGKIGSGQIGIDHMVSGYPGYRVASGYSAAGLTGAIPEPRISGLIISGITLSGGLSLPAFSINEDITALAATVLTPNFGIVDLVDGRVTSGITSSGIETSYTYRINSVPFLRVYAEADGLGGLQNEKVQLFQQVHVGSLSVPLTTSGGYLTSAVISGWMGFPRLHSGLINLSSLVNIAMMPRSTSGLVLTGQGPTVGPAYAATAAAAAAVPSGGIIMWAGTIANIPSGYVICDGNNGTPNLLAKFVEGVATAATNPGTTGGATTKYLTHLSTNNRSVSLTWVVAPDAHGGMTDASAGAGGYGQVSDDIADIRPLYYDLAFLMKT